MRDYAGASPGSVPDKLENLEKYLPEFRRDLGVIDYFLRDLSRAMKRISDGDKPDGSGDPIIPPTGDFWFKPGIADFFQANMQNVSGGSGAISSTAATTKGFIYFGSARTSAFDETNQRIGLAVAAPEAKLDMLVGPPVGQTARPSIATALHLGIGWGPVGAATLVDCIDDADADLAGLDYARYSPGNGFNDTLTVTFGSITNPGVTSGFSVKLTMRSSGGYPSIMRVDLANVSGAPVFSSHEYGGDGYVGSPVVGGNVTTGFVQYTRALTAGEVAAIDWASTLRVSIYNSGLPGSGSWDVSQVEIVAPAVGGGSAETLQKWSTPSYSDLLDFTADGSGGATLDLSLTGDAPLRVDSGGGTSGLRFLTSSTNGRIEAGTSAAANMNLVLSGTRATAGTLLTSDFTAHLMNGALDVFLSTDRTGLRVRQFTSATFDLIQFSGNNGTSHFYRIGSDGQSYFASSTTAGVVNIGAGAGSTVFKVGTTGTTGVLTLKPNQSSIFEVDVAGLPTTRFTTATKWSFLNSTALRGTTSGELTFAGPATITDHTLTWPSALPAATSALHVGTGGAMSYVNLGTTYQALDADLTSIAGLTGDGGLYRTAADTWALRDLAVGSDRLTISNADGVSGNPSYDASMASANWDWTRGLTITSTSDEIELDITPKAAQTAVALRVLQQADAVRMFEVSAAGIVTVGDTTHTDSLVRFQVRTPTTQAANITQVIRAFAGGNFTAASIGSTGTNVFGDTGTDGAGVVRMQIRQGSGQSVDIFNLLNSSSASLITINSAGQVQFTSTAGVEPIRIVSGAGVGKVLTSDVDGDASWQTAAVSYTDENAQDAIGAMVDTTLIYTDATPLLSRAALTGDVTASVGSNALTIANDAVTFAKFQNITDARLLGRNAGSAGDMQEITLGTNLSFTGTTINAAAGTTTSLLSERATQVIAAATTMVVTDGTPVTPFTTASGSNVTSTAVPFIAAGRDGQFIVIRNDNGTDAAGLILRDTNFFANSGMRLDADSLTLEGTSTAGFVYSTVMSSWVFQWYKKLKHYTGAIASFTVDASSGLTHEWGDGSTTNDTAPVFALTYSGIPTAASVTITASPDAGYPLTLTTPFLAGTGAVYFRSSTRNGTRTFRASATVNGSAVTSDVIVTYQAPNYSGSNASTTTLTSANVVALTHTLDTDPYNSYGPIASGANRVWFAFVNGDATLNTNLFFAIGGARASFTQQQTNLSVTSQFLKVQNYDTFMSALALGTVTVVVQSTRPPTARYVGKVGQNTTLSEAQIEALQITDLTESSNGTFPSITGLGAGDYLWFCVPAVVSAPTHFGISPGAGASGYEEAKFSAATAQSVTNIYGFLDVAVKNIHSDTTGFQAININAATTTTWSLKTQAAAFNYRFFVGPSTATAISSAQILAIDDTSSGVSSVAAASLAGTYAVTVSGSNYLWVCHEDLSVPDIGTIKDVSTGFAIAGSYRTDVNPHTNDFGVGSLTYRVWRSDNPAIFPTGGNVVIT